MHLLSGDVDDIDVVLFYLYAVVVPEFLSQPVRDVLRRSFGIARNGVPDPLRAATASVYRM